jgi:DNA-binding transcriptional ArsR family regulator
MMASEAESGDPPTQTFTAAAETFALLASPTRLHIVWALVQCESDVTELAQRVGATPQAVSQHLAKLKLAGAVLVRSEGRRHIYAAADPHLQTVARMMIEKSTSSASALKAVSVPASASASANVRDRLAAPA